MPLRSRITGLALQLLTVLGALAAWEALARSGVYSQHLFPPPSGVLPALLEMARNGELLENLRDSGRRWGLGFALGSLGGIAFGLLSGRHEWLRVSLGSLLGALGAIPKVVLIPIAILWFGIGETQKVLLVAWGAIFPVWLSTQEGSSRIAVEHLWAARSLGLRGWGLARHVLIPNAMPAMVTGLRIGIANATFSLAAAEMAGAFTGLVHQVFYSHQMFQTERMFAGVVTITVFAWALNAAFSVLVRLAMPWLKESHA